MNSADSWDSLLKWVGAAGFFLSLVSLGWQVWSFFFQWKPRIRGEVCFVDNASEFNLQVRIWNVGRIIVHVTAVELVFEPRKLPYLRQGQGPKAYEIGTRIRLNDTVAGVEGSGLEPGRERFFELPHLERQHLHRYEDAMTGRVSISVTAPIGEVLRLEDENTRSVIASVISAYKPNKPGASIPHAGREPEAGK